MKRIALLTCLLAGLCILSPSAKAQFRQGDLLLSGGLAAGVIGHGGYPGSRTLGLPPITANLEYSIDDMFAVGPYIGFFGRSYKNNDYKISQSVFGIGGRFTFHATNILNEQLDWSIDESRLDIYASVILGFNYYSYDFNYSNPSYPGAFPDDNGLGFVYGPVIGARYFFSPKLGVYAEAGRGAIGVFTIGISSVF